MEETVQVGTYYKISFKVEMEQKNRHENNDKIRNGEGHRWLSNCNWDCSNTCRRKSKKRTQKVENYLIRMFARNDIYITKKNW